MGAAAPSPEPGHLCLPSSREPAAAGVPSDSQVAQQARERNRGWGRAGGGGAWRGLVKVEEKGPRTES